MSFDAKYGKGGVRSCRGFLPGSCGITILRIQRAPLGVLSTTLRGSGRRDTKKKRIPRENSRFQPTADEMHKGKSRPGPPIGSQRHWFLLRRCSHESGWKRTKWIKRGTKHTPIMTSSTKQFKEELPSMRCTSFGNVYLITVENWSCWQEGMREEMNNKGGTLIMTSADPFPNKENSCLAMNGFYSFTKHIRQHTSREKIIKH